MGIILIVILVLLLVGALPNMAPQFKLGTLSERRNRIDPSDRTHPVTDGANLRRC